MFAAVLSTLSPFNFVPLIFGLVFKLFSAPVSHDLSFSNLFSI